MLAATYHVSSHLADAIAYSQGLWDNNTDVAQTAPSQPQPTETRMSWVASNCPAELS